MKFGLPLSAVAGEQGISVLRRLESGARKIQVPCEEEFRWTSVTQGGHKAATDHVQPGILAVEVGRRFGIQEVELQRLSRVWVWGRGSKEVKAHPRAFGPAVASARNAPPNGFSFSPSPAKSWLSHDLLWEAFPDH